MTTLENNGGYGKNRSDTINFNVLSLFQIIKEQDEERGDVLAANQKALVELKREISICSKKNFSLEKEIHNLDNKIALLIKNRITLEEAEESEKYIKSLMTTGTTTLKDKRERELYGQLFHLLQRETIYIATLARLVKLAEIDNLLQTVMFTLYGNQYDEEEEHLLLSMFQRVLKFDFEEANGVSNLLRANTALTRMMTTYTRRGPGQAYLKATLTDVLTTVTSDKDLSLEINPLKVYEQYINDYETKTGETCPFPRKVTAEEAAARPEIQEIIRPRLQSLDDIATQFIDALIGSIVSVPYGIRWICKQIRSLAKEKFRDVTREQICSLIGGFFILRFINPAVVTPQAFMLVDTKLSANTRRNLTLLAKILQNLANNMNFGGVKEFYMEPLNKFLGKTKGRFNQFLENLTRVENLDDHLNIDKYLRLGRTEEIRINITLNEMYFIHRLLKEHQKDLLTYGPSEILSEILNGLGEAPAQLPRNENSNVDLVLLNRYSGDDNFTSKEMKPEQLYTETKYLLFTIIKSLPRLSMTASTDDEIQRVLIEAQKYASEKNDFKLADKVKRIHQNCKKLVSEGIISAEDNFAKLRRDTVQELANYEAQIERTSMDLQRLKAVLKNIHEHNEFLKSQYDAYKEYLANVRYKCATGSTSVSNLSSVQTSKSSKSSKNSKTFKKGPVKFSHVKLEEMGIITKSEVPEERRSNIFFSFNCPSPGFFDVTVQYKSRNISEMKLQLDDLLERQHNNETTLETDFLQFNVNKLIHCLNSNFLGK